MPTPTYDLIASNVLTSSASSVTFSSIPATYRDLVLVIDAIGSSATDEYLEQEINGDTTSSNYFWVEARGNGSSASSFASNNKGISFYFPINNSRRTISIYQMLDYSATDKQKTILARNNVAASGVEMLAARWASTSAVTSWKIIANAVSFGAGSTFYLYGIVS